MEQLKDRNIVIYDVTNPRDKSFDLVKFIAMLMVVYWHVFSYRKGFLLENHPSLIANIIVGMNMPVFFMVSGFFSRRLHESGDWIKIGNRFVSYFWPLAVFSVISSLVDFCCVEESSLSGVPMMIVKRFLFGGWFFYALAAIELSIFFAYRFRGCFLKILVGVVLYLMFVLGCGHVWHARNIVAMMPFYVFGIVAFPMLVNRQVLFSWVSAICIFVYVLVTCFCGNIRTNGLGFYWDYLDVWCFDYFKLINMIARYALGVAGSVAFIYVVKCFVSFVPTICRYSYFGEQTFGVYLLQGILIKYCVMHIVDLGACPLLMLLIAAVVYSVSYYVVAISKRSLYVSRLIWGPRI